MTDKEIVKSTIKDPIKSTIKDTVKDTIKKSMTGTPKQASDFLSANGVKVAQQADLMPEVQPGWLTICKLSDIAKNTGVCADFNGKQVAIFHIQTPILAAHTTEAKSTRQQSEVKAVANLDPFAQANVLSRGLITEKDNQFFVASPLLKQEFCLSTGQCQQDESVTIPTYQSRIEGELVQLLEA